MEQTYSAAELYLPYHRATTNYEQVFEDFGDYPKDSFNPHRHSTVGAL